MKTQESQSLTGMSSWHLNFMNLLENYGNESHLHLFICKKYITHPAHTPSSQMPVNSISVINVTSQSSVWQLSHSMTSSYTSPPFTIITHIYIQKHNCTFTYIQNSHKLLWEKNYFLMHYLCIQHAKYVFMTKGY